MADDDQVMFMLGEIKGQLEGMNSSIKETKTAVEKMDTRVRKVETRAAINGAVTGGTFGLGISLITMSVKEMWKSTGGGA